MMLIPKNRHEYYLAVISGNDYPTFPPKIREEQYLAKLAGREVDVPIPKTPKERAYYNIIKDIKFEPENRWQTFVAAANDDSITAPAPITREEIWWSNISLSHEVIVEYVGTLPATLQTVAGYLESYKIYGNTVQDGTPTPENPIMPSGCGERTANLFDVASTSESGYIDDKGNLVSSALVTTYDYIDVTGNTEVSYKAFTLTSGERGTIRIAYYDGDKSFLSRYVKTNTALQWTTATLPSDCVYVRLSSDNNLSDIMLIEGSTAPTSYIPYGYKLPLTANGVENPIYLGEVQTTRKIKKLVLTGKETLFWSKSSSRPYSWYLYPQQINALTGMKFFCTHGATVTQVSDYVYGTVYADNTYNFGIFPSLSNVAEVNSWLAQQYANGTPVTVWYILAEPETGIVNEPLMKIGGYADTIDSTQTAVQIPTTAGETTISWAGEGLAPSEVELKYKTIEKSYISADDKVYQDPNGQLLGG